MFGLGMQELLIVGIVAVLLFGRKLPDVARSLGHSYREFRGGLNDLKSQVSVNEPYDDSYNNNNNDNTYTDNYDEYDDRDEATAPRFEPPPSDDDAADSDTGSASSSADGAAADSSSDSTGSSDSEKKA